MHLNPFLGGVSESALQGSPFPLPPSGPCPPSLTQHGHVCSVSAGKSHFVPSLGSFPFLPHLSGGLQWGLASPEMKQHFCLLCKPFWWRSWERCFLFGRAAAHADLPLFTRFHHSMKPSTKHSQCQGVSECHLFAWLNRATRHFPVCLFLPMLLSHHFFSSLPASCGGPGPCWARNSV